ncbi:hypothetical protein ACF1BN_37015 [Streptomyces sp. NPDC014861]|uniref:hypothetical protein n=1 Tax=Streptomyces sp. NPDC014861 TaxID=3364923 RepID=UPI0037010744
MESSGSGATGTRDVVLVLDVQKALETFLAEIDRFSEMDPDIAWVKQAVDERFAGLPEDDVLRVLAPLWPGFKSMLMPDLCPPGWPHRPPYGPWTARAVAYPWAVAEGESSLPPSIASLRHGLVEGARLRRLVESALDGALSAEALRLTARQIKDWELSSASTRTRDFDEARDELARLVGGPERKWGPIALGFVVGLAAGMVIGSGHVLSHHI